MGQNSSFHFWLKKTKWTVFPTCRRKLEKWKLTCDSETKRRRSSLPCVVERTVFMISAAVLGKLAGELENVSSRSNAPFRNPVLISAARDRLRWS